MLLDAALIRRRREELGLSVRAVAARLGVAGNVVVRIEAGDNHPDITLGLVAKLADALALNIPTLCAEDTSSSAVDVTGDDVATLGALLHAAGVLTPAAALCDALGWDKARLDACLKALDVHLRQAGMRVNRNPAGYSIVRSVEPCPTDLLAELLRSHIARDGLNITEASMLRRIASGAGAPREPTNAEAVALGVLGNAGLVAHGEQATKTSQAPLVLAEAVRFSLLLDEEPEDVGAELTAMVKRKRPTGGYRPELAGG